MEGRKINDGKVERKKNFGCLVERRKWEGKKSERKKMERATNFFPLQIREKMNKTKIIRV